MGLGRPSERFHKGGGLLTSPPSLPNRLATLSLMYLTFMWIFIVELDSCSDSGRDTYSARDHPTNCDADPLWSRKVHSATESISSGITQNRPVRVTSKPAKGEGSGH